MDRYRQVGGGRPAQSICFLLPGKVRQGGQGVKFRLVGVLHQTVIGEVVQELGKVQIVYIIIIAGEKAAHRGSVGHPVPLHLGGEGLVDPVELLLGEDAGGVLRERGGLHRDWGLPGTGGERECQRQGAQHA